MMTRRYLSSVLGLFMGLGFGIAGHAALYRFTVGGRVTVASWPDVHVGDTITIQYTADSHDRNPSPSTGSYAVSRPVLILPDTTIIVPGYASALSVYLNFGG